MIAAKRYLSALLRTPRERERESSFPLCDIPPEAKEEAEAAVPGRIFMALLYGTGEGEMEKAKLSLKHLGNGISAAFEVRP